MDSVASLGVLLAEFPGGLLGSRMALPSSQKPLGSSSAMF